jgi:hypothetical protein
MNRIIKDLYLDLVFVFLVIINLTLEIISEIIDVYLIAGCWLNEQLDKIEKK